jgi:hypothetical protein
VPPNKAAPSASPGTRAVQAIEKDFSGDEDPDGICLKCILRGLGKGALIAAATLAILALIVAALPEALAAFVATWATRALFLYFVKGVMDLANNWGNMSSAERQEAVAEIVGGVVVGGAGAKLMPKPGALWPKGGFGPPEVGATPDGFPMPVPEAEPTVPSGPKAAEPPMEMGRKGRGGAAARNNHRSSSNRHASSRSPRPVSREKRQPVTSRVGPRGRGRTWVKTGMLSPSACWMTSMGREITIRSAPHPSSISSRSTQTVTSSDSGRAGL